jgi:predicted HicB family RNase H-like nuclease
MNKKLENYLNLPYVIELVPIAESLGGGYTASLPQVGRFAVTAHGETPDQALSNLEVIKKERFADYLDKNIKIPEPEPEREDYSGRFVVRIPKVLHKQLVTSANENQISLNQHVTYLLAANLNLNQIGTQYDTILEQLEFMCDAIWDIQYSFQPKHEEVLYEDIFEEEGKVHLKLAA